MRNKQKLIQLAYETSVLYAKEFPGEPFHDDYTKHMDLFRRLIKSDRKLEKNFTKYFKELADRIVDNGIMWIAYQTKVNTASELDDWIKVDWDGEALTMKVILTDSIIDAIVAGGMLMQLESKIDIGWNEKAPSALDFLQKYGLKLAKTLNETTKEKVKQSLSISISNGEDLDNAVKRMRDIIDDPKRAATIARTESVNAFGAGRRAVAVDELGWKFKEWHALLGACEICVGNERDGRIEVDKKFSSGDLDVTAHPNDRCSVKYYKDENSK